MKQPVHIFWFRRDLRPDDNAGLFHALSSGVPVVPLFIFDKRILDKLEGNDPRISFIHTALQALDKELRVHGGRLLCRHGDPMTVWKDLIVNYTITGVFTNCDYEPYSTQRDMEIRKLLLQKNIPFHAFKDQVIFEKNEVVKADGSPYTVYTPYMKKWMTMYRASPVNPYPSETLLHNLARIKPGQLPGIEELGFQKSELHIQPYDLSEPCISNYEKNRDIPGVEGTSRIGPYLRFGLIGIRRLVERVGLLEPTFLKELIWREFFMQIIWHFPEVTGRSFKKRYDRIPWINDEGLFKKWCDGQTGYPIVDAGMRELKTTGYMHNRVRMITASFLCKHLLTDWRWGEAWFAKYLLDYELSSNNGNWQWAAGTGCDAAPYFRVFNPYTQQEKFDPSLAYIRRWVPEFGTNAYPSPIVDHKIARERAIATYRKALNA